MPNVRPFFVNPYMMPSGRDIGLPPVYPNMHKLGQIPKYLYKNNEKSNQKANQKANQKINEKTDEKTEKKTDEKTEEKKH